MGDYWNRMGSAVANLVFVCTLLKNFLPPRVWDYADYHLESFKNWFNNDMTITYEEFPFIDSGCYYGRSKLYKNVEAYLEQRCSNNATKLKAKPGKGKKPMKFNLEDYQTIRDEFQGIKVVWFLDKQTPKRKGSFLEARRSYQVTFDRRYRDIIMNSYIKYVDEEGKKIVKQNKFQKIYNNEKDAQQGYYLSWNSSSFEHPASFDTLAMEPCMKQKIINDLEAFRKGEEYYKRIGKSWKRGYLLYGPPGTGKSSLIAAMANLLQYDIYNLELTAINDNIQLNKLLQDTSKKSILVIEDIDCSLDLTLTSKRENKRQESSEEDSDSQSKLTLSGLLNSIDGLSSGCIQERIFVFTTNHVEKLDPALIRRGRMDMHVEMSYCRFEAFKVLAKNYLNLESHHLFEKIRDLLEEGDMTPADVAENLMPKCLGLNNDGEVGLESLIVALEEAKEAAMLKAQEKSNQAGMSTAGDHDENEPSQEEQEQALDDENESIDHNDEDDDRESIQTSNSGDDDED